jgi:hypothetical protein
MGKTWVLRTETKGTGAQMVPLERATKRSSATDPVFVPRPTPPRSQPVEQPRGPRRFRIVDVMTRQSLLEDGSGADAIDALQGVRSIVDVSVYVWQEERERWRPLTFAERRAMFDLASR